MKQGPWVLQNKIKQSNPHSHDDHHKERSNQGRIKATIVAFFTSGSLLNPQQGQELKVFYTFNLPLLLFLLLILFSMMDLTFPQVLAFIFGYSWSFFLLAPYIEKYLMQKKFRFSLVRLCYLFHQGMMFLFQAQHYPARQIMVRLFTPFVLAAAAWAFLQPQETSFPAFSIYLFWGGLWSEAVNGALYFFLLRRS